MKKTFLVILSFSFLVLISSCRNNGNTDTSIDVTEEDQKLEMEIKEIEEEIAAAIPEELPQEENTQENLEEELKESGDLITTQE